MTAAVNWQKKKTSKIDLLGKTVPEFIIYLSQDFAEKKLQYASPTIDLWSFSLKCSSDLVSECENLLSDEEKERLRRFHFDQHKRRFIVRRSILRVLLSHLTGFGLGDVEFEGFDGSKRVVSNIDAGLEFNTSHSGDRGVIATGSCPLGIDIESLDRPMDYLRFARHNFTNEEYQDIALCRGTARRIAFFNCWTGKEAYTKALGVGLSRSLRGFAVHCAPNRPPGLRWDAAHQHSPSACRFFRYTDDKYVMTVVLIHPLGANAVSLHQLSSRSLSELALVEDPCEAKWRESK